MPGQPPDGQPVPADGSLPDEAVSRLGLAPFGVYVHVPFCQTRCGYCDFNTYTASELGSGASRESYARLAIEEIRLAARTLAGRAGPVQTVFFGGGTPTLLPPSDLAAVLRAIDGELGLAAGAEVTAEANPETVDEGVLAQLRDSGFTRISLGMQSAVPHVLAVLDRVHEPGRPEQCVRWAKSAGFRQVSLDLIYGTPGESDADWQDSLGSALAAGPDHISAYSLIVEDGTRLAARISRGELPMPDDDVLADRYLIADEVLGKAGLTWYEISNWAAGPAFECGHNLLYWTGADWWGVGYAQRIAAGISPGQAREILTDRERATERVMLATRLAAGCPLTDLAPDGLAAAAQAVEDGLACRDAFDDGTVRLTQQGRLLADAVIRSLTS